MSEAVISWDLPEPILNMPWNAWNRKSRGVRYIVFTNDMERAEEALALCWKARKRRSGTGRKQAGICLRDGRIFGCG